MTQFILAYEVGEHTYTCKIDAPAWDEAEHHLRAIAATGRVSGEHVCDVPVQENCLWYRNGHQACHYTTQPDDEALLKQELAALESLHERPEWQYTAIGIRNTIDVQIAALRERLGETK